MDVKTLIQRNRLRKQINDAAYETYVEDIISQQAEREQEKRERESKEAEEVARKRQTAEELKQRAADDMAKQDQNIPAEQNGSKKTESGLKDKTPQVQTQLYIPESTTPSVKQNNSAKNSVNLFDNNQQKSDTGYPKNSLFDAAPGKWTFDPNKPTKYNYGETWGQQKQKANQIENKPIYERTPEEQNYYWQITQAYLDYQKIDNARQNYIKQLQAKNDEDMQMMTGGNYLGGAADTKWIPEQSHASTAFAKWGDNTIGLYSQRKNESEISTYKGFIDKNIELRQYASDIQDYDTQLDALAQAQELYEKHPTETQKQYINYLKNEIIPMYAEKAKIAATYIDDAVKEPEDKPSSSSSAFIPYGSYMSAPKAGYKHTLGNLINKYNLQNNSARVDRKVLGELHDQLHSIIGNNIQKWDKEDAESREGMRKNIQELENWKKWRTIDEDYLAKANAASRDMSFTDPNTYLYGLGGVLGSSASFNGLQWANTALSMAGGYLSSTGAGAIAGVPMIGAGLALGIESGRRENAAEVSSGVEEVFQDKLRKNGEMESFLADAKKKLGKDVDYQQAMWAMALGDWEPSEKHKKEYVNSTFGANNLFKHDMMAVVGSNLLETTINVVPFGKFAESTVMIPIVGKGSKVSKLRRLARFKEAHPTLYKGAETFRGNLSEGWYNAGAAINPVVGAGFATLGAATKPLRSAAWNTTKRGIETVSAPVTDALVKKFGNIADWSMKAPKSILNAKVIGRSGADWISRVGGSMWSESLEEGKQHYHGKEFKAGNYAGESDSMWEVLLGDIEGGSKSALQFTGSYLGFTSDDDWIVEMRSGALAGGGHTAVATGFANVRNAAREISANNIVINNILATKLEERAAIEKGRAYASKISFGDRKAMNQVFDNVKELQHRITEQGQRTNNPEMVGISDENIEEQRAMYNRIFNIANSNEMRNAAEERGIRPGSDKYATLVSLVDFAQQNAQVAIKGLDEKTKGIAQTISNTLFGIDNVAAATDDELLKISQEKGIQTKRSNRIIFDAQAIEENKRNRRNAFINRVNLVDYIAHLDALLTYRDQLELKDGKTAADKRKLRSINKQLETLRNSVKERVETVDKDGNTKVSLKDNEFSMINSAPDLQKYIYDIDLHEVIRDQYRDVTNYTIDFDNALAMQYNLVGDRIEGAQQINNEQVNEIIQNVSDDLEKQYKATAALTDNKDININGESISHINVNEKAAKKARKVIDDYINSVKSDEELEQRIHDDTARAIEELYGQPSDEINNVTEETQEESKQETQSAETVQQKTGETQENKQEVKPKEKSLNTKDVISQAIQEQETWYDVAAEISANQIDLPKEELDRLEKIYNSYKDGQLSDDQLEEALSNHNVVEQKEAKTEESTVEQLEDIGELYSYIDNFNLTSIPEDKADKVSQNTKSEMNSLIEDLNNWIKKASSSKNEKGLVTSKDKEELIKEYTDLLNRAETLNQKIDSEIKLAESKEAEPEQKPADKITNEDVVEASTEAGQKWLNDFYATLNAKLGKVQQFLQGLQSEQKPTKEGVEEIKQTIADIDAVFNSDEVVEGLININPDTYSWYFGNFENPGARSRVMQIIGLKEESLPQPQIDTTIPRTAFDENAISDPDNWGLLSNTTWNNPKYPDGMMTSSVSTTNKNYRLQDAIGEPEFMTNAKFELIFQDNNQPFVVVHYKSHTFTPVFIQTAQGQNRSRGFKFWNDIKLALAKTGKNQMVVPVKVSRALGKEKRTNDDGSRVQPKSMFEVGLINNGNMYTLEFSPSQDSFGITEQHENSDGISVITVYTPSENGKGHQAIYEYSNSSNNAVQHGDKPAPGVPVFLYNRNFTELGNRKAQVPINMLFTKMTLGDANLILEILRGQHCADRNAHGPNILAQEYVQEDDRGNLIEYGMTNGEVLNLLLRYGYKYDADRRHIHLEYNPQDNRRVSLVGYTENADEFDPNRPDQIPSREFNLFDENEAKVFVNSIAGVINRAFDQRYAASRVGEQFADATNPFRRLNEKRQSSLALQKMLENGGKIKFGDSAIEFDIKDFVDESNKEHSAGVSGIVWYARHGFLNTQFNGFENTILVFDEDAGVAIVDRETPIDGNSTDRAVEENEKLADVAAESPETKKADVVLPEPDVEMPKAPVKKKKRQYNIIDDDELAKKESKLPDESERIDLEQAKQHILDILGDKYFSVEQITEHKDLTVEQILNMFKNGPVTLGFCSHEFIKLSKFARRGTEYHEVFHAVVELLLDDKQRQKVYEAYAKAKNIKLYDKDGNEIVENMKAVTEGLADEFMLYAMDRPTIKLTWNIRRLWNSIVSWMKFYNNIGSYKLYKLYRDVNRGKYKDLQPSEANKKRCKEVLNKYKEHYFGFTISGKPFQRILNHRQYKNLCDTMVYILYQSQKNIDRAGRNMKDFKMDDPNVIREYKLFKKYAQINPALEEMLDNWSIVRKDVRTKVEQIGSRYIGTNDDPENVEDIQGDQESAANAGIGDYTRDSQEFSQFSRAGEKVKHFFALIPAVKYAYDESGQRIRQSIDNAEGLPHFVNASTMYNTVLNQVYNCRSLQELVDRLESIGQENAQFAIIYERIKTLQESASKGNVEDATLLTQLCVNLHASKGEYIICKATRNRDGSFDLTIQPADGDYAAKNNRYEWSKQFAGGLCKYIRQDENGNYVMNGSFKPTVFRTLSKYMTDFKKAVSPLGIQSIGDPKKEQFKILVVENGSIVNKEIDVTNGQDLQFAKQKLINILNNLGITFNLDMLNYMLNTKYGSSDYNALNKLFTEDSQTDIEAFARFISGFDNNGKLNVEKTENGWTINTRPISQVFNGRGAGFVGMLATWAYNYKKSQDQLSILANKQNRQYLISENNYLTDTIDDMNVSIKGDTQKIDDLKSFVYNWFTPQSGQVCGSVILKNYTSSNPKKLRLVTDSGFKTDAKGDIGEDYAEISQAQDEVSKMEMLLQGKIILPTMSDKKTWGYIDGINLPGLDLSQKSVLGQFINTVTVNQRGSYQFSQNPEVLEQLRQYAILEHEAVLQTLKDVKGYTDPVTGEVHKPMDDGQKIKNYHKAKVKIAGKSYSIVQGARYSSLYAIYDHQGRKISFNRVLDEKGNFMSEEDNIATAMEHFFGVPSENEGMYWVYNEKDEYVEVNSDDLAKIQRLILNRSLQLQLRKQLDKAERLGIIEKVTNDKSVPYVYRFKNKLISSNTLKKVKSAITENLSDQQKESLAIAIIMNDVSCKSIMSLQETERIFSGHPSFYKWQYNSKGVLSDRSTDQHKRFGGLVSTGQNNAFVFENLPRTYKAAEINDIEVESEHVDMIERLMYEGTLRSTYLKMLLKDAKINMRDGDSDKAKELANKADSEPIETIESSIDAITLEAIKRRAKNKSNAFRKDPKEKLDGINVADGATYVTDDMCENLLKNVGSYGEDIQRAFKVLRGEEVDGRVYTTKDVREMLTAYELIQNTVIGTQKYTAYGFRKQNGILVPYYNKTALFPLFKCIAHGKTAQLYSKMKSEGVDMVMLNSAVKVGSQGSKDINWDNFESDFHFNTYEQEYRYLRKQFNTDPKEKELMAMGTQMTKIIMSSMLPGREYVITDPDGSKRKIGVVQLRDEIMNSINQLSNIGYNNLRDQLFDGDKLDVRKFSEFLTEELSSRGASRDLLDAVSVIDENSTDVDEARIERIKKTGKPELKVPLVALSGMNWIQSIINSKVNKNVIDINTPGAAFIQRSIFGMEGPTESTVIERDELPDDIYEGRKLMFRNENGSMDCVLSIDFFENIIPPTLSFAEARQWLIDNKVISGRLKDGTWSDADASIVGYRIPTQAISSIHALRCVDVIETVRDTVILPTEFTKITGSDFDIDKLFLSTIHYNKKDVTDASGNIISRTVSKKFKEGTEKYYVNKLMLDQIALLKDQKDVDNTETRSMQNGDGSIDNDTELLISIVKDLEAASEAGLDPYDTYSLWRNTSIRDQFITGKFGIGPFALNNNNHILTMLYGVKFAHNPASILGITGHESLCDGEDMYGESIMSWLSGLINAHVDVAKDPYISKLNVNKYTYNLVNLMVRTGFGKMTFWFTTQPILKEIATRVNNAASAYGSDPNKSKFARQRDAEKDYVVKFVKEHFDVPQDITYDRALEWFTNHLNKLGTSKSALFESLFNKNSDVLHQVSKQQKNQNAPTSYAVETKNGTVNLSVDEIQMVVYLAKTEFDKYSDAVSSLVKYCKIDTKKQGKSIAEQRDFMRGYRNLFMNSKSKMRKLFDTESLDQLNQLSYIQTKTNNATKLFKDIIADQLVEATDAFGDQIEDITMYLPIEQDEVSQQIAKKVSDSILVSIRSDFFNTYASKWGINIRDLVSGDNTIYDRLNRLKIEMQSKDEYEDYRNPDRSLDNYLINTLTSGYTHKQALTQEEKDGIIAVPVQDTYPDAKFLSTMTFMDDDSIDVDEMTAAWEELLEDSEHPELQKFARDLIVYSFITTGGNGGANNIFKYIPASWLVSPDGQGWNSSYAAFMSQKLQNYNQGGQYGYSVIDDIILNNWTDNQFIPTVKTDNGFESYYVGRAYTDIINGKQVAPQTDVPVMLKCDPNTANSRFIKINRAHDKESQRSVAIYKKVKVGQKEIKTTDENGKVTSVEYLPVNVYVLTEPKGQNFGGKNKIYEYGREDSVAKEVTKQLKLDKNLVQMIELLGGDLTSMESVLDKLVSFIDSKENKTGALDVLKAAGINKTLYDTIVENSINKVGEAMTITSDMVARNEEDSLLPFENDSKYETDSNENTAETKQQAEEVGARTYKPNKIQSVDQSYIGNSHKRRNIQFNQVIINHLKSIGIHVFGKSGVEQYLKQIGFRNIQLFIGNKRRQEFEKYLKKHRPDLSQEDINTQLDFLHSLEDNKDNAAFIKTAIRWIANRSITLPQDTEKAMQAFNLARSRNIDLQKFNTLGELITSPEMLPKEKQKTAFDPDKSKTFSNKRTVITEGGRIFTVYDVENTDAGQRDVCKALAAHYEMSPWCLSTFTKSGQPTESAKKYWNQYNAIPRKIAYENGRPVAFSSIGTDATPTFNNLTVSGKGIIGTLYTPEYMPEIDDWIKDGLVERIPNEFPNYPDRLMLTEKGWDKVNKINENTEAWWDMEDDHPQSSLTDDIVSDPVQRNDNDAFDQYEFETPAFYDYDDPDFNAQMEFSNHLSDEITSLLDRYFNLIENLNVNDSRQYVVNSLLNVYLSELSPFINEVDRNTNLYDKFNEALQESNLEEHIKNTINEYYHSKMLPQSQPAPVQTSTNQSPFLQVTQDFEDSFDLPFFKTQDGQIYGFVDRKGNIYIDDEIISPDHLMHEYTHIWDRAVFLKDRKLWDAGIRLMKELPIWNEILNDQNYGKKWVDAGYSQEHLDFLIGSEVHSRLVGNKSDEIFTELAKTGKDKLIDHIKQWVVNVYKFIYGAFGYHTQDQLDRLTIEQFNSMTIGDFLKGTHLFQEMNRSGDQTPDTFKDNRKYDPMYKSSSIEYLNNDVRNYLQSKYTSANSITSSGYTLYVKTRSIDEIKTAISSTGGYINDFSIVSRNGTVTITPKGKDYLLIDTLEELRKTLKC